jgi:hypothetical protein
MSIDWASEDDLSLLQKNTFYAGILVPFRKYRFSFEKGGKTKTDNVHNYVIFESLKQPTKTKNFVDKCLKNINQLAEFVNSDEFDVVKIGTLLKDLEE